MKKLIPAVCLFLVLAIGVHAMTYAYQVLPVTYDGREDSVIDLINDPKNIDVENPDGAADIIVQEDLDKTMAVNNVASIVFDYRGYDTLGESFILLTAIAGSYVILSKAHGKEGE